MSNMDVVAGTISMLPVVAEIDNATGYLQAVLMMVVINIGTLLEYG